MERSGAATVCYSADLDRVYQPAQTEYDHGRIDLLGRIVRRLQPLGRLPGL